MLHFYFIMYVFNPFFFSFKAFFANSSTAVPGTNYKYDVLCQLQEKPSTNLLTSAVVELRPARQHFCLRQAKVAQKFCCCSFGLEIAVFFLTFAQPKVKIKMLL